MTLQPRRCHHCNRAVYPTVHEREGARVDYYRMVAGRTRTEFVDDPRAPGESMRVVHVEALSEFVTCRDCWDSPDVRTARARLWEEGR